MHGVSYKRKYNLVGSVVKNEREREREDGGGNLEHVGLGGEREAVVQHLLEELRKTEVGAT